MQRSGRAAGAGLGAATREGTTQRGADGSAVVFGEVIRSTQVSGGGGEGVLGTLSGGEKQMLALANALIVSPRLLLLDEPSLGLAPPLVSEALACIHELSRNSGMSVLIVEQKVREFLKIADRVYVLRNGRVSFTGAAAELCDDAKLREVYL